MRRFAAAWRFLTVFPFPLPAGDDEGEQLRRSPMMFPLVGLVLGLIAAAAAWLLRSIFPPLPAAALVTVVLAMFSVGLHLDGVCDCGDALMTPGRSREDALAIMKDSRIGAHGAVALVLLLLVKFAALASCPNPALAALAVPVGGRGAVLLPMVILPYVREKGLGRLFDAGPGTLIFGAAMTAAVLVLAMGWLFWAGLILWAVAGFGWVAFLRHRLGGATGDGYGAACEIGETATALAVCMTW